MSHWYCKLDGRTSGPFLLEELKFLARRGKLSREDRVQRGPDGPWLPAASVPGLFGTPTEPAARAPRPSVVSAAGPRQSPGPAPATPRKAPAASEPISPRSRAPEPGGPPARLPTGRRNRFSNRTLTVAIIAAGLAVLILLILLLTQLRRPSPIAESGGSSSGRSSGDGAGGHGRDAQGSAVGVPGTGSDEDLSATTEPEQGGSNESTPEDEAGGRPAANGPTPDVPNQADEVQEAPEAEVEGSSADIPPDEPPPPSPGMFSIRELASPEVAEVPEDEEGGGMFSGRTAGSRSELVGREGGSEESEAAVERGLNWLARHQSPDGRWCLDRFDQTGDCGGQCTAPGTRSDTAGTALALLPFLAAGHTHRRGEYFEVVENGLDWLIENQQKDGSFRDCGGGRMYAHGQAAIALSEALAMTRDKRLRKPAQAAIDYIVKAQHAGGGWRYSPGTPGDTSVLGWQIMALESAQAAKLKISRNTFRGATKYLDSAQTDKAGGLYGYMPRQGNPTPPMTAEGLLCRQYTGWHRTHGGLEAGVEYLLEHLPDRRQPNMYYWYYATQVMHHYGGDPWKRWNSAMRDILIESQESEGHRSGSWAPGGGHDSSGGRLYMTALATCTLQVYYRHASLYAEKD